MMKLSAILNKEDNMYVAKCPEVGTVSQGKTVDKAIANLKEATELYLEEFPLKNTPIIKSFEVATDFDT
ncbi:type II toxin-antitoxin system HicB family antitoxin [Candidatus Woesearchaeota archaeon]|nr:type II toxin-antitoxin system HicB family antitoxin [Candidatus Woesearchaeota archaeon]